MKLLLDIGLIITSIDHEWFSKALTGGTKSFKIIYFARNQNSDECHPTKLGIHWWTSLGAIW